METMETVPYADVVTSVEQLRTIYRPPTKLVAEKKLDHVPPWIRVAIEASRFAFVATADADGPGDGVAEGRRATGSPCCSTSATW